MIRSLRQYLLDRMVLRPSRNPIEYFSQERVVLRFESLPLECFVQRNHAKDETPELLVLKFPGTAGRAERSTRFPMSMQPDVRTAIWTWNPPGYGGSGGRASLSRIARAAVEFWVQVTDREPDAQSNWICGNSLGCAAALHVAASMQPDPNRAGILLRNPPPLVPTVKRIARRHPMGRFTDRIVESLDESMDAAATAPRAKIPAVFLHSELDTIVPLEYQKQLVEAYGGPHRTVLMEGLGHGGIATDAHESLIEESIQWLSQQTGHDR